MEFKTRPKFFLFDIGEVLVRGINNAIEVALTREKHRLRYIPTPQELFSSEIFLRFWKGELSKNEFQLKISKFLKTDIETVLSIWDIFFEIITIDRGLYYHIQALKEKGYRVGCLSNADPWFIEFLQEKINIYELFDRNVFLSYQIGLIKPDPQIFEFVLRQISLPPNKILFIDDNIENTTSAERLGFITILYENLGQYLDEIIKRKYWPPS